MSTLLKTEHLKKYYGKKKIVKAVDDVSLEIHAGSSMALIGESGSGKTTFGKLIAGLEKPTDGKVWFQGQEMQDLSEKQFRPYRKNLQMVFQSSSATLTRIINSAMPLASGIKVLPRPWIAERYTYSRYSTHKKTAMINKYLYAISNTCRV